MAQSQHCTRATQACISSMQQKSSHPFSALQMLARYSGLACLLKQLLTPMLTLMLTQLTANICMTCGMHCRSMAQVLKNHGTKWELNKGEKLTPVLAVGSNAAPAQLARKFPAEQFPDGVVIPVLRCVLPDFDVVYAPLISSYGSCTGALALQESVI